MDIRSACANAETTVTVSDQYFRVEPFVLTFEVAPKYDEVIELVGGTMRLRYNLVDVYGRKLVESDCFITNYRVLPEPVELTISPYGPVVAV